MEAKGKEMDMKGSMKGKAKGKGKGKGKGAKFRACRGLSASFVRLQPQAL